MVEDNLQPIATTAHSRRVTRCLLDATARPPVVNSTDARLSTLAEEQVSSDEEPHNNQFGLFVNRIVGGGKEVMTPLARLRDQCSSRLRRDHPEHVPRRRHPHRARSDGGRLAPRQWRGPDHLTIGHAV